MKPYYNHGGTTIYHGDCREILPLLDPVSHVITDPPYSERTSVGAKSNRGNRMKKGLPAADLIDFGFITDEDLQTAFAHFTRLAVRWVIAFGDFVHVARMYENPPEGLRSVRICIWNKPDGAPQFTGDRPGTGFEAIFVGHKEDARLRWNGGGTRGVFTHNVVKNAAQHPSEKPLPLMCQLISLFTDRDEVILDPFMGSGTTLRAAKDLGRLAIGIEIEEKYCELAAKRLQQEVLIAG